MNPVRAVSVLAIAATVLASCESDSTPTASFNSPTDGATIAGDVAVEMTADGITIEEAGEAREGAGALLRWRCVTRAGEAGGCSTGMEGRDCRRAAIPLP